VASSPCVGYTNCSLALYGLRHLRLCHGRVAPLRRAIVAAPRRAARWAATPKWTNDTEDVTGPMSDG